MKKRKGEASLTALKGRAATLQKLVDSMPTSILILQLNSTIKMLEQRGVVIRDWDNKDKVVRCICSLGGRYYFMATKESKEAKDHGNSNADRAEATPEKVPLSVLPSER